MAYLMREGGPIPRVGRSVVGGRFSTCFIVRGRLLMSPVWDLKKHAHMIPGVILSTHVHCLRQCQPLAKGAKASLPRRGWLSPWWRVSSIMSTTGVPIAVTPGPASVSSVISCYRRSRS